MTPTTTYQKVKSSTVSKGARNSFKEMFPLARMFPLAVMHREAGYSGAINIVCCSNQIRKSKEN